SAPASSVRVSGQGGPIPMHGIRRLRRLWFTPAALSAVWLSGQAPAAEPVKAGGRPPAAAPAAPAAVADDQVLQAQAPPVPQEQPPTSIPAPSSGTTAAGALGLGGTMLPSAAALGTNTAPRAEANSVAPTGTSVSLAGSASPVAGSSDLSELLSKSPSAAGV